MDRPEMSSTDVLLIDDHMSAALRILEITCKGASTYNLDEALDGFVHAYEIVKTATEEGVEEARAKLEKK